MKEAVGESAMTIITIILVSVAVIAIGGIIGTLLKNQSKRANCENAGYSYDGGVCYLSDGSTCNNVNSEGVCED